jgi:hypothetical protein
MIRKFAGVSIWSEDLQNLLPFYRGDDMSIATLKDPEGNLVQLGQSRGE